MSLPVSYEVPAAASPGAQVLIGMQLEPPAQRRWTVLIRYILALPLLILLGIIAYAALAMAIVAWFASLIRGRVPDSIQRFLTSWCRLSANVEAYALLLVPRWPGVVMDATGEEQVTVEIDHVDLNQVAVLFRLVLAVPAILLGSLLELGIAPFVFVMWIIGSIRGQTPVSLHQATASVVRYRVRLAAYVLLISPTQPWHGLFGDLRASSEVEPSDPQLEAARPPALPQEAGVEPSTAVVPAALAVEPRPGALSLPGGEEGAVSDLSTIWLLSATARRVLGAAVALGVVLALSFAALSALAIGSADARASDRAAVTSSQNSSVQTFNQFAVSVGRCSTLVCARSTAVSALRQQLSILNRFESDYVGVPAADAEHAHYLTSLVSLVADYTAAGRATSDKSFNDVLSTGLVPDISRLHSNAQTLYVALGGSLG